MSLFFKTHRQVYYDLLTRVRTTGDWEAWLAFFLDGVKETSDQAVLAARRVITLLDHDCRMIDGLGRAAASARRDGRNACDVLRKLGVLREISGKQRLRLFAYGEYLSIS